MKKAKSIKPPTKKVFQTNIEAALKIAWTYGMTDGSHHKNWVIDHMVKVLIGNDDLYNEWKTSYEAGGEYEWDIGIAP